MLPVLSCEKQKKISLLGKNAIFLENLILILYDEMCHDTDKYVKLRQLWRLQWTSGRIRVMFQDSHSQEMHWEMSSCEGAEWLRFKILWREKWEFKENAACCFQSAACRQNMELDVFQKVLMSL